MKQIPVVFYVNYYNVERLCIEIKIILQIAKKIGMEIINVYDFLVGN